MLVKGLVQGFFRFAKKDAPLLRRHGKLLPLADMLRRNARQNATPAAIRQSSGAGLRP